MSTLNDRDRENLTAYLDGELDEKTAQALEAKINLDPDARKEVEELRKAWAMLDYLPKPADPAGFTHRTLHRITVENVGRAASTGVMRRRRIGFWFRSAAWAGAIAAAAGLGLGAAQLIFPGPAPAPSPDEILVRHLRIMEKWRQYENIDDLDFVRALDHPELFGREKGS
jgi:anti-sigma factor RsiW